MKKPNVPVCTLILALGIFPLSGLAAEPIGELRKGVYGLDPPRVRYFAFLFEGNLTEKSIASEVAKIREQLLKENLTGVASSIPRARGWVPPAPGEKNIHNLSDRKYILIAGWMSEDGKVAGWIAVNRADDKAYPKHEWLDSAGKTGQMESAGDSDKCQTTRTSRFSGANVHVQLRCSGGKVMWFQQRGDD